MGIGLCLRNQFRARVYAATDARVQACLEQNVTGTTKGDISAVADLAAANHHHPTEERVGAVRCLKSFSLQEWREALRV